MRRISLMTIVLVLAATGVSSAQAFIQFTSPTDLFAVSFPGQPSVREISWTSEFEVTLPGRVYSVENARGRYSMTVVDYKDTERLHVEKAARCEQKKSGDTCVTSWRMDVEGAPAFVMGKFLQRDAKATFFAFYVADVVPGLQLQLLNADQSRTFATVNMHGTQLYILEATVPRGAPAPGLFQQSLMFLDEKGQSIRYQYFYSPFHSDPWKFPSVAPPRTR